MRMFTWHVNHGVFLFSWLPIAVLLVQPDQPDKRLRGDLRVYKARSVQRGGSRAIEYIPILRPLPPTLFMIMPPEKARPSNYFICNCKPVVSIQKQRPPHSPQLADNWCVWIAEKNRVMHFWTDSRNRSTHSWPCHHKTLPFLYTTGWRWGGHSCDGRMVGHQSDPRGRIHHRGEAQKLLPNNIFALKKCRDHLALVWKYHDSEHIIVNLNTHRESKYISWIWIHIANLNIYHESEYMSWI